MKTLISFLLRNVPRKYLQLVSHYALTVLAIFYKGNKVECPVCQSKFRVFLPYGRQSRSNALCPKCLSLERHRLMWLYLKEETDFFTKEAKLLHVAPEHCFIDRFEKIKSLDYITADIESPLAKVKMDVHEIPFKKATFDMVFCNHVLEHVNDDRQALREIYRVLKPGGWAILLIPLYPPLPEKTFEDPSITDPKEREKIFHQDDHVRNYGVDFKERFEQSGLKLDENYVTSLSEGTIKRYALTATEEFIVARKLV